MTNYTVKIQCIDFERVLKWNIQGLPRRSEASLVELLCSRAFQWSFGYNMRVKFNVEGSYTYTQM